MAYDTYAATMPRHGSTPSCAHPQLPIREDQKASWQPKCWRRSKRSCDKTLEAKLLRRCERQHCSLAATLVALSFSHLLSTELSVLTTHHEFCKGNGLQPRDLACSSLSTIGRLVTATCHLQSRCWRRHSQQYCVSTVNDEMHRELMKHCLVIRVHALHIRNHRISHSRRTNC